MRLLEREMRLKAAILSVIVLLNGPAKTSAYGRGAPSSVCDSMSPSPGAHRSPAQSSNVPYKLEVKDQEVWTGDSVELELTKINAGTSDFVGLIVQGRDQDTGDLIGTFNISDTDTVVKDMGCANAASSSVTHQSNNPKSSVVLTWIAPAALVNAEHTAMFHFTVVQSLSTYWTKNAGSRSLRVKRKAGAVAKPQGGNSSQKKAKIYEDCFQTKGCFGSPPGCESKGNCGMMLTYKHSEDDEEFDIELYGRGLSGRYVAAGLSKDGKMGDDLVLSCTSGGRSVATHWNAGKTNKNGVKGLSAKDLTGETVDGATTCKFSIPEKFSATPPGESSAVDFDLASGGANYFLMLAMGSESGGTLQYHDSKVPSGNAVDLTEVSPVGAAKEKYLVQVHGVLMVLAWVSSATCGMVIARYYKQTWKGVKPLGKDLWFRCHQGFMGLTVALSFVSFWVIVAKVGFLDYSTDFIAKNPHPAVGMSCIICALIQPVMAYFRPHPGTGKRTIFDWAHWLVGNAAFVMAVAAIFLAVDLDSAQLPKVMSKVLIAFVALHFVAHVVLTGQRALASHRHSVQDSFSVNDNSGAKDMWGTGFRKCVVVVYALFVWSVGIALCVLIFDKQISAAGSNGAAEPEAEPKSG